MFKKIILVLLILSMTLTACNMGASNTAGNQSEEDIILSVFAGVGLIDVLNEIKGAYEEENPGVEIQYNFASAGTLQKQIEGGAEVDYFISPGVPQMDALEEKGLIQDRQNFLQNKLVLVGTKEMEGKIDKMEDLLSEQVQYISIGTPETVPVGKYAKEALIYHDLWDKLQEKIVLTKDVRQALTYVDTGNADVGIVYYSDVFALENAISLFIVPEESHTAITYPAAIVKSSPLKDEITDFNNFLTSSQAGEIFERHGFLLNF